MSTEPAIPRVDELRQQLRSLGYLDAGVDRFVLGSARETRRPLAIAWLASLRIGVVAALLLGPAAAIGVAARVPGLITGPRDGFVVAAYVGASVCRAACSRRRCSPRCWCRRCAGRTPAAQPGFAIAAGVAFTVASLAYLTLWWDASTLSARARCGRTAVDGAGPRVRRRRQPAARTPRHRGVAGGERGPRRERCRDARRARGVAAGADRGRAAHFCGGGAAVHAVLARRSRMRPPSRR